MRRAASKKPRASVVLWACALLVTVVACVSLRNAVAWYGRPNPGLLIDAGGSISSIGLPNWENKRLGLRFPDLVAPAEDGRVSSSSRTRVAVWDEAVERAQARGHLDALVVSEHERRVVRLELRPLEPLAWWVYAGGCILGGILYAGAGLVALWASPSGRLAQTFARFAIVAGLFLLSVFDVHTERTLTPVFFLTYAITPPALVLLMLNLPEPVSVLKGQRRFEIGLLGAATLYGAFVAGSHFLGHDVVPLLVLQTSLFGFCFAVSVAGFLVRYLQSHGEQQRTLRALLISMVPPYAAGSAFMVLTSLGLLGGFPDFLLFPAFIFAPLTSLYSFVRYDLWGSRALLSRIATSLFVGGLACAVAIAAGTAIAAWMGARFRDAFAGAAGGGIAAAAFVVLALRVSEFTLFRSRAEYKPTIDKLGEELTALTSASEVTLAIERTVRRWLRCDFIRLTLATGSNGAASPPAELVAEDEEPAVRPNEPPRDSSAELRLEVAFAGKALGWLDVGAKRGGALFTSDDIDLLRAIANHGGLALAHAHAYQELEDRRQKQAHAWRGEREALVETVAAEMAHEIRYPINYFRNLFERSAHGIALTAEDIDVGREEVDRLERLVSGLKRMAAHRMERRATFVTELCVRVEALLRDALGKRKLEIEVDRQAQVRCDSDKMTQVLVNLLSNALEACGPNGRLGIRWRVNAQGGELTVWDDGPGFVGDSSRLFAPWFTTKPRGTGLGLAITHRLVRSHGWNVVAERRDAHTEFVIQMRQEDLVRETHEHETRRSNEAKVA